MIAALIAASVLAQGVHSRPPVEGGPLSCAKQLAVALVIYAADEPNRYLWVKDWKNALARYVKREQWHHPSSVPHDAYSSFSLNEKLRKKNSSDVRDKSKTVLLYMGKAGKFTYNTNGKTVVSFVDTSTKWLTKKEVKALKWNP